MQVRAARAARCAARLGWSADGTEHVEIPDVLASVVAPTWPMRPLSAGARAAGMFSRRKLELLSLITTVQPERRWRIDYEHP